MENSRRGFRRQEEEESLGKIESKLRDREEFGQEKKMIDGTIASLRMWKGET